MLSSQCHQPAPRLTSSLVLLLVCRPQVPVRLQTCQCYPCSLVRTTSSCHHSSCQPRVMHFVLDTSSTVPRSWPCVSLDIQLYSFPFRMFRFSFFILDSSLLPLASLFVSFAIGHRPSPLLSTSRFDIKSIRRFLSEYRTLLSHTMPWTPVRLRFPFSHLSLRSVHCIATD